MAVLDDQVVAQGTPFALATRGNVNSYLTFTVFTVPAGEPCRIESVYIEPLFPDGTNHTETWELTFVGTAGLPIFRQPTPQFGTSTAFSSERITWARDMSGTTNDSPVVVYIPPDTNGTALATVGLPDIVLPPAATVVIGLYEVTDGGLPSINVTNIAVTYTPGGTGTAQTVADVTPFLLSTTNS